MSASEPVVPMRTLIAAFSSAAKAALVQQGWQKRSGNVYTLDLNDGFLSWLGLNRASKHRPLTINPVVGVVYEPARKLEHRLHGSASSIVPTLSEPLRYLTEPPTPYLRIADTIDAAPSALTLVELVETHGVPFAKSLATPEAIVSALQERRHLPVRERALTRLPAMLASLGRVADANDAIDAALEEVNDRSDAAADEVRAFAHALREFLEGLRA